MVTGPVCSLAAAIKQGIVLFIGRQRLNSAWKAGHQALKLPIPILQNKIYAQQSKSPMWI
jgi:hypothetical protein